MMLRRCVEPHRVGDLWGAFLALTRWTPEMKERFLRDVAAEVARDEKASLTSCPSPHRSPGNGARSFKIVLCEGR